MIKRSLLWVLAVYCIGIVFRDRLKWILGAVLFSYAFFICIMRGRKTVVKLQLFIEKEKRILLVLPSILLLGAILGRMQAAEYPMDAVLTEKTVAVAEGRIRSVTETKSGWRLELNHIYIRLQKKDGGEYSKGKLLVYCDSAEMLQIGNEIRLQGKAVPFAEPENLGQFDEKAYYRAKGLCCKFNAEEIEILNDRADVIREWCRGIRNYLDSIYEEILPEKHAGIVSAILLGDKAELDAGTKELYQKNGIAHILAISGLHVSLLGMGLFSIVRKFGSPLVPAAVITVLILLFYGSLTEFGVSTQRAVGMLVIAMFAKILGRSYDSRSACALCGLLILIANPMQLYQTGFQLSFAAAFGISYFGSELKQMKLNRGKTVLEKLTVSLLSGLTTQLITVPIILNSFYEFPIYSVFLNLPVVGLLSSIVFLSIIAGVAGGLSYSIGKFFAGGVYIILELYEALSRVAGSLPFPIWLYGKPAGWRIGAYYIVLIAFFGTAEKLGKRYRHHPRQHQYRRQALLVLCLLSLVFVKKPGRIAGENAMRRGEICAVDFLSVGQGDCSVIRTKNQSTYVIDCGSSTVKDVGEYRLEPWLKYHGISKLEAVFLSHPDSDHTNGVVELLENMNASDDWYRGEIQIKNLVLPAAFRKESVNLMNLGSEWDEDKDISDRGSQSAGFANVIRLAHEKKIPILWYKPGDEVKEEGIRFVCLHPKEDYPVQDTNEASMVLCLESENASVVFTGDVGKPGEERMIKELKQYRNKEAQQEMMMDEGEKDLKNKPLLVLKVAHHGSKNSTSEAFLKMLQPDIAAISCGRNNSFGHPHQETIRRLQDIGSNVAITAQYGTVTVEINENNYKLKHYKAEKAGE